MGWRKRYRTIIIVVGRLNLKGKGRMAHKAGRANVYTSTKFHGCLGLKPPSAPPEAAAALYNTISTTINHSAAAAALVLWLVQISPSTHFSFPTLVSISGALCCALDDDDLLIHTIKL